MCFTKFSLLIKVFDIKDTLEIPMYFHRFNHFSLFFGKSLDIKNRGGIIKVVAVVDMVLNFLITDKNTMDKCC